MTGYCDVFDVITCNDVIEHVTDPGIAIKHVASMLRNGGIAYFEIPNRDDVSAVIADGHYQLFGITQLEHDLAAQYYGAHAPGVRYGVEHYLRLPEYRALFDQAGLSLELHRDAATTRSSMRYAVRSAICGLPFQRSCLLFRCKSVPTSRPW